MADELSMIIGVAFLVTGMATLFYATYLEMICAGAQRWFHHSVILALASLLMIVVGLVFLRR